MRTTSPYIMVTILIVALAAAAASSQSPAADSERASSPAVFTAAQVASGRAAYRQHCAQCHGADLLGGSAWGSGPPLAGDEFAMRWRSVPLVALFEVARGTMPPARPGALSDREYASVLALILAENGFSSGSGELPATSEALARVEWPATAPRPAP